MSEEAARRGVSLTALMREAVAAWRQSQTMERAAGFDAIVGLIDEGPETDVAARGDDYRREAVEERLAKKMGRAAPA